MKVSEIRRAQEKDIPRMLDLLEQVCMVHHKGRPDLFKVGTKYDEAQLRDLLTREDRPIFVALDEEGVVEGYAFCISEQILGDHVRTDVRTLYIDDLCVEENVRGGGFGRALYDYVIDFARKSKYYNVTLNVWSCNESAMKFYEKCGLKPQKVGMECIL